MSEQTDIATALRTCAAGLDTQATRLEALFPARALPGIGPHNYAPWVRGAAIQIRSLAESIERYDGTVPCGGCGEMVPVAEAQILQGDPLPRCGRCMGEEARG